MLGKLYKALQNGKSISLKNEKGTIILKGDTTYMINKANSGNLMVIYNPARKSDFSAFDLEIVTINNFEGKQIIEKTNALSYNYEDIKKELIAEINKYGPNKLFNRLIDVEAVIFRKAKVLAALEVLTGETFQTDRKVKQYELTLPNGTKKTQIALFGDDATYFQDNVRLKLKPGIPLRKLIEQQKPDVDELFAFGCLLALWQYKPIYIKVSKQLFERADEQNKEIETYEDQEIFELVGDRFERIEQGLVDVAANNNIKSNFHYIAIIEILARLQRQTNEECWLWVVKGKPNKYIYERAREKKAQVIDTNKIKHLTGETDKQRIKRIKEALLDLPNNKWYITATRGNDWKKIIVCPVQWEIEQNYENGKLTEVYKMILNRKVFRINEQFILHEANTYTRLLSSKIPSRSTAKAAALVTYLRAYNNSENSKRVSYLSLKRAAELIGWKSKYDQRRKAMVKNEVIRYLDYLKETGVIECYKIMKTGQFRIVH